MNEKLLIDLLSFQKLAVSGGVLKRALDLAIPELKRSWEEFEELKRLLWRNLEWTAIVEIIPQYAMGNRSIVAIRYNNGMENPPFLRYSKGPFQCYFWDIYGDDFQSLPLAILAISRAPPPRVVDPLCVTIPSASLRK